ncbi:MAG: RnfABCDGE type electron transport complex subunit G [Clostridia bacterium]|nr:RnfABCDGE type electron transport complex subunit G [Clostridia bacterium]MBQ1554764.1 RnfABCDGE type electron transport complex subunit G [Clostridia bacterium]
MASSVSSKTNSRPSPSPISLTNRDIWSPVLVLTAICAIATLVLAMTNLLTAGTIAGNAAAKAAQSRRLVLAAAEYVPLDEAGQVYEARDAGGQSLGVVVTTRAKGYGGTIEVMTGIRADGAVNGVTILSMSETPGLGAKTKEPGFLNHFIGARVGQEKPLAVDKDGGTVNAVSGATISSRAVTDAVNQAIAVAGDYLGAADSH